MGKVRPMGPSWDILLKYASRRFLKKKTTIYNQGDVGEGFYYIDKGAVKIVSLSSGGGRILDIAGPGTLIGEQVLDDKPYFSSAIAIEDTVVYYFSRDTYRTLVKEHPELVIFFANLVILKVRMLINEINLKPLTSEYQVAYSLLKLAESCKKMEIDISQQELADFTGLTRITIYKIMKKWKEEEWIDIQNRKLLIRKPEALKQYISVS
ncbi:Crp/Fnr family transcriptional regulator [Ammoniphilus sp. CFH 90114]|nr:Crp/Fnr family transcriptional regulator [Ammoniphilus sp. CFH 90114]